ncbi:MULTISPECIES: Rv0361 family membrane protein [unclassified Micromonospora]|uniref:Rv0361 family membrane protein n=1 Tax=unclassified Micromonospora TaxID=2617518 RepID=UPI0022CCCD44|nr:hypothetical protein [Micromonospora sp. AKA38]GHJ12546.1 hypothetical protein TPA0908_05410 [Micromonospora sp. AKA38]
MTQPPAGGTPGTPGEPIPQPASAGALPPTGPGQPPPGAGPPPGLGHPPYPSGAPPRKRPTLLIVSLVLAAAVLLCGGGGTAAFLALRDGADGQGATEPQVAVDGFLKAVYQERDADKAATFVCSAARDDEKIAAKVAEVQKYAGQYQNPRFRWTNPTVDNQTGDRATVSTKVTMTTADEKVADQDLRFTVVRKTGWWVCEVS